MENENYGSIIGSSAAPNLNALATKYGNGSPSYSAIGHPSLPNYIMWASGQAQPNSVDDAPPATHTYQGPTLADILTAAGHTVAAYGEAMPSNQEADSGLFAVRHFPWSYFPGTALYGKGRWASNLLADLNSASPPDFVWYTPNLNNDMHNTNVATGDAWIGPFIQSVQATSWYKGGASIVIVWDESGDGGSGISVAIPGGGGAVDLIVVNEALHGVVDNTPANHAGLLASICKLFGVAPIGEAAHAVNGNADALLNPGGTPVVTPPSPTPAPAPGAWGVTLAASTLTPAPGATVTLVATSTGTNADLWTHGGSNDMVIADGSGKVIARAGNTPPSTPGGASIATASVSAAAWAAGGNEVFTAAIGNDPQGNITTLGAMGAPLAQAQVTVNWGAPSPAPTPSPTPAPSPSTMTLTLNIDATGKVTGTAS